MRIIVTIEEPTAELQEDLLKVLAKHAAHVEIDTTWTPERAERFYRALPERARRIVREAAIQDGYVSADDLRGSNDASLRGHSAPIKQALDRGVVKGWWPAGMQAPIQPHGPGFGKVVGYRMPNDLVSVFFTAIRTTLDKDTK